MKQIFRRSPIITLTLLSLICLNFLFVSCTTSAQSEPTSTLPPEPTTTPTPLPTDTPQPTDTPTPLPTDTPTPTPTYTPTQDFAATAAVEKTQTSEAAIALIRPELEAIGYDSVPGSLGWFQTEPEEIKLTLFDEYIDLPVDNRYKAKNFIFKTDIIWESTSGLAICGFNFRADSNQETGDLYRFVMLRLSGLPVWNMYSQQNGEYLQDISVPRTSSAIDQTQGGLNKVILIAEEGKFTIYINDQRIGSFFDYQNRYPEGQFGFNAAQESGTTTCRFENSWVWELEE